MARVIEQLIAVKLSKIVKDSDTSNSVIDESQVSLLMQSIPELAEQVISDPGVVVEVLELE